MGAFYGSIHIRTEDHDSVIEAVEKLVKKQNTRFWVGPELNGWVGIYPEMSGQNDKIPKALTRLLQLDILYVGVHDSDVFFYSVFSQGKLIDQYNSNPDYFSTASANTRRRFRGQPAKWKHLLPDEKHLNEVELLLTSERPVFAEESLRTFARLLNLANTDSSYEYLLEEHDHVMGWNQFSHIPKGQSDKDRQATKSSGIKLLKKQLQAGGKLLHSEVRKAKPFGYQPIWCNHKTSEILVAWASPIFPVKASLNRYQSPWKTSVPIGLDLDVNVHCLAQSASGKYLACGFAGGNWQTQVYDLAQNNLSFSVPHQRAVTWVGFTEDEQTLLALGSEDAHIVDLETGRSRCSFPVQKANLAAILSNDTAIIADNTGRVILINLMSGAISKSLYLSDKETFEKERQLQLSMMKQTMNSINIDELYTKQLSKLDTTVKQMMEIEKSSASSDQKTEEGIRQQLLESITNMFAEMKKKKEQAENGMLPIANSELIMSMEFDPQLQLLAIGTSLGVRVYSWSSVEKAEEYMPSPQCAVLAGNSFVSDNYVYALAFDVDNQLLLHAGLTGVVNALDLTTGKSGQLLAFPGRPGITNLTLTKDNRYMVLRTRQGMRDYRGLPPPDELSIWNYTGLLVEYREK